MKRGAVEVEVQLHPLRIHVRRAGRRLLRGLHAWVCDGVVHDRFLQLTEGVIAREELGFPERAVTATVLEERADAARLRLHLQGGREAQLQITLLTEEVRFELHAADEPLRLALEWDARPEERFNGLGARHTETVDHHGRAVQLGADRRYTGPDCPPDMLELGGIPQGDYAPVPWLQSSRGYALWLQTDGNGTRFELGAARERVCVSQRATAGDLRLHVYTDPTPAARLRRFLRATGMPALLPEWGYGFWKSRDVYDHQDDVLEDFTGCGWHGIPLDAVVLDSPWETQYNTWIPNPHQFPDFAGMVRRMRDDGVRTVVWVVPWTNLESLDGQIPDDPGSRRLHREPASNYEDGLAHYVRTAEDEPYVARWWMGTGSPVDFTSAEADDWWRAQARPVLELGVEGIKTDDGEGYYFPDDVRFADGTRGADAAWRLGGLYRESMQRALDEVHGPGTGVLFGRCGWTGQQSTGMLWAGDQASDFWSLRVLLAATLNAASSGFSNWSHDVGGYLGERGILRCSKELLVRWAQLGCFTPLMQAHGRLQQEPWTYDRETLALYRGYVLLHEMLVPYVRAAAATAARVGLPIVRPLPLVDAHDDRGWSVTDGFGYGPSLWVAPVVEDGAREREALLPRGEWIEAWSGETVVGGEEVVAPAPLHAIPVWVRRGAIVVTLPAAHVAAGLGDTPAHERPLHATLWGEPRCGRAKARLADGTTITWRRGRGWSVDAPLGPRDVTFAAV
ncbi:MAG TPA: TIM-barrel domain-containing protein [Solirubrobacteraceae bacterium]